jgi:alpha-L-rhamnosidase
LTHANAVINALTGKLVSDWTMENGTLTWNIKVPMNTTATIIIPVPDAKVITESGNNIYKKNGDGIKYSGKNEKGEFVYVVGGGEYSFAVS